MISAARISGSGMLHEIQLLVRSRRPEILPIIGQVVAFLFAFGICEAHGAFLTERWIHNSIPISKIPEYLNCNRTQAQMLVKRGIVSQLAPDLGRGGGVLTKVAVQDLDDFISRFRAGGTPVRQASDGMMDVISASEVVRRPVTDIVCLFWIAS